MTAAAVLSLAHGPAAGPRQYKDKWPRETRDRRARPVDTRSEQRRGYTRTVLPKHVTKCAGTGGKEWFIYTWDPKNPGLVTRVPYMCGSWRCPVCRRHEGAMCFARVRAAFQGDADRDVEGIPDFDPQRVAFCVLTIDRDGYYSGQPWKDEREAYASLSLMQRKLMKRVNRKCQKEGWEPVGSRWVSTVEAHKSGWPHLQLMMYVPEEWAEEMRNDEGLTMLQGWFAEAATAVGWGRRGTVDVARSMDSVAGYLTKTAGAHEASVGEVAKLTQLPLNAPSRFRRLRSGKGFLPPRCKGKKTGTLVRRRYCEDGTPQVEPLHEIKNETARELAEQCCYKEEQIWRKEVDGSAWVKAARAVWPAAVEALETPRFVSFEANLTRGPPVIAAPETARAAVLAQTMQKKLSLALPLAN